MVSGLPNEEGVRRIRELLRRERELADRIAFLEAQTTELGRARGELGRVQRQAQKELEQMDVASNGNFGWQGRVLALILLVEQQVRRELEERARG